MKNLQICQFISEIFWPIVVLIITIISRKAISEKILSLQKLTFQGKEAIFAKEAEQKEEKRPIPMLIDGFNESGNPVIAIPRIYSRIEAAVKKKFNIQDVAGMLGYLADNNKIDTGTFILLDSMRNLRKNIRSHARSQKITKENIKTYKNNADRIIQVIHAI